MHNYLLPTKHVGMKSTLVCKKYCFDALDDYALHCDSAMANNAKRWPIEKDHSAEIETMKKLADDESSALYHNTKGLLTSVPI